MRALGIDVGVRKGLDLVLLSVPYLGEIWILDHSTTTAEARGTTGGRWKHGGDLLYRWGNPRAHRWGTKADQRLFKQHHAHWIPKGYPGAGNILVFNNGNNRPDGSYSTADEIALPGQIGDFSDLKFKQVEAGLKHWTVKPTGTEGYRTAEVTLGGVDTADLDSTTMAAREVPGLYFIGECVDVTGWLGGYNFQWAWSSGWAAGQVA